MMPNSESCGMHWRIEEELTVESNMRPEGAILFISHDASLSGAPMSLLNILRWLNPRMPQQLRVLLRAGGPLEGEFRKVADVRHLGDGPIVESVFQDVRLIYSNTATNGLFLRSLPVGSIPIVTHIHELERTIEWNGNDNLNAMKEQSSHFIACSSAVEEMLTRVYRIDPSKISVIPEAIFPWEVQNKSQIDDGIGKPSTLEQMAGRFLVAGSGIVHLRKGCDLFVQLAKYCTSRIPTGRSIGFIWTGGMSNEFSSEMFQHDVQKLGLEGIVRFVGELENPYPCLGSADIFCLPSREDPFPLVMLEAGALGKPVLAFERSGGAEEYCRKGGGFLVPYLDVAAMGNLILRHLDDRAGLAAVGEKARRLVQDEFSLDATGPKLESLIRRLAQADARPDLGTSQLFLSTDAGYAEENSARLFVKPDTKNRLTFTFSAAESGRIPALRFDPLDRTGLVEITSIVLKSQPDQTILWQANRAADFKNLRIEGTAFRMPDPEILRIFCFGPDPIIQLPPVTTASDAQQCKLEVEMRAETAADAVAGCFLHLDQQMARLEVLSTDYGSVVVERDQLLRELHESRVQICELRIALMCARLSQEGRKMYIWGTGTAGEDLAQKLIQYGHNFHGFVDRDPEKFGKDVLGRPVFDPLTLQSQGSFRPFVVIASIYWREIEPELIQLGYVSGVDYTPSPLLARL